MELIMNNEEFEGYDANGPIKIKNTTDGKCEEGKECPECSPKTCVHYEGMGKCYYAPKYELIDIPTFVEAVKNDLPDMAITCLVKGLLKTLALLMIQHYHIEHLNETMTPKRYDENEED